MHKFSKLTIKDFEVKKPTEAEKKKTDNNDDLNKVKIGLIYVMEHSKNVFENIEYLPNQAPSRKLSQTHFCPVNTSIAQSPEMRPSNMKIIDANFNYVGKVEYKKILGVSCK